MNLTDFPWQSQIMGFAVSFLQLVVHTVSICFFFYKITSSLLNIRKFGGNDIETMQLLFSLSNTSVTLSAATKLLLLM